MPSTRTAPVADGAVSFGACGEVEQVVDFADPLTFEQMIEMHHVHPERPVGVGDDDLERAPLQRRAGRRCAAAGAARVAST